MEILEHRRQKLDDIQHLWPDCSPSEAAKEAVKLVEVLDSRYKGPHRKARVDFWRRAILADRAGQIIYLKDIPGVQDGLCRACVHPENSSCLSKQN